MNTMVPECAMACEQKEIPIKASPRRKWIEYATLIAAVLLAVAIGFYDGADEAIVPDGPTSGGLPVAPPVVEAVTPVPAPIFPGPPPATRAVPNVELTVYVLRGSDSEPANQKLPGDWEPIVRQLGASYPYKTYGLMDIRILRARSGGSAETTVNVSGMSLAYNVSPTVRPGKAPRTVRLEKLRLRLQDQDNGINTELDALEGQKTVAGKMDLGGDAVIVVVAPKVIE